mmetsp:Transcript_22218/g.45704  ORF Transcript_22218/g.45704 Transcript_22218/m.45704 type:complete len:108 (-) Transcript_22218:6-329(-)
MSSSTRLIRRRVSFVVKSSLEHVMVEVVVLHRHFYRTVLRFILREELLCMQEEGRIMLCTSREGFKGIFHCAMDTPLIILDDQLPIGTFFYINIEFETFHFVKKKKE